MDRAFLHCHGARDVAVCALGRLTAFDKVGHGSVGYVSTAIVDLRFDSPSATTLHNASSIGLIQDVRSLNAFLAAAGVRCSLDLFVASLTRVSMQFTEAAAFQQLPDPPFVLDGWATAPFQVCHHGHQLTQ